MDRIEHHLVQIAQLPAVDGCALVQEDTGMVWHHSGQTQDIERMSEAVIEFWRVHQRLRTPLASLGSLRSAAFSFSNQVVALFPCSMSPPLVLVCIIKKQPVDWSLWSPLIGALNQAVAEKHSKAPTSVAL